MRWKLFCSGINFVLDESRIIKYLIEQPPNRSLRMLYSFKKHKGMFTASSPTIVVCSLNTLSTGPIISLA